MAEPIATASAALRQFLIAPAPEFPPLDASGRREVASESLCENIGRASPGPERSPRADGWLRSRAVNLRELLVIDVDEIHSTGVRKASPEVAARVAAGEPADG